MKLLSLAGNGSCDRKFLPLTGNFFLWMEMSSGDRKCLPVTGNVFLWQNLETQSPLLPCLLNPLKMPPFVFLSNNTCLAFSKFLLSGETIKTFTRITDTILNTFLMDWTSQLELSLAKFDITVWMSAGRFSQTPCTHITTLCRSRKPCNCHYETNALYLEAGTVLSL